MSSPPPESIFFQWLERHEEGHSESFEDLCQASPQHAERLRELHGHWNELDELRRRFGRSGRFSEQLAHLLGPDHSIGVELDRRDERSPDFTVKLLGRLASRGSSSTRYRDEGEIASGGMGAVLRVWDEDLRRFLAMKVMLAAGPDGLKGDDEATARRRLGRFLEEAQVTGQLDHPGIVPVHEMGLDASGRVYFTMKLVKGKDLRQVFGLARKEAEGWSTVRALGLLLRVCDAMRYAHDKGVIHRDLKPANVMVGRYGEVYVMDWGLARILGKQDDKDIRVRELGDDVPETPSAVRTDRTRGASDEPLHTMDGDVVGTPAYMPPEQARGDMRAMGPHSDVYATGAMLYHLLAGQMPYVPSGHKVNSYAVWQCVQQGPPRPLSELAPEAPEELVAICDKAMAREVGQRYASMSELAQDLSAYLEGRVVRAHETGAWAEARKWVQRNRALASSLAAALLLLVVGLVASSSLYLRAEEHARDAEANSQRAQQNQTLAEANEAAALAERAKVLRLSDVQRLQEYQREADLLWPAYPDKLESMRDWVRRARALAENLEQHRATLASLRADVGAREIEGSWRFGDTETQWQHDVLAGLVSGLERFADDDPFVGAIASVEVRLLRAESIEERSYGSAQAARRWAEAIEAVGASELYEGLELEPQLGLLPLGPDPDSGLWEFAHLESGLALERDEAGRLRMLPEAGMVFVLVPGGRFHMGAQARDASAPGHDPGALVDEAPVRELTVEPFLLSKYELTQAQWMRLTGENPSESGIGRQVGGHTVGATNPVDRVSWIDCERHLGRQGLQLPSEAQWEYAARAGTTTPWSTGARPESLDGTSNIADQVGKAANTIWSEDTQWEGYVDGHAVHAPVGSFAANPFGLHDMHGNLWEWCSDYKAPYDPHVTDAESQPADPGQGLRCNRGGAYYFPSSYARCARRYGLDATIALHFLGVRPARALQR